MIALVLLNLLNKMRKKIRCEALPSIFFFFSAITLINSIISEYKCKILFII